MFRRRVVIVALFMVLAFAPQGVFAGNPSINAQAFRPSPFPCALFGAHGVRLPGHLSFGSTFMLGYARGALAFEDEDDRVDVSQSVVRDQVVAELSLWTALYGRVGLGVTLPLFLAQVGEDSPLVSVESRSAFAVGDLRIAPQIMLFWNEERNIGLALDLTFEAPTAQSGRFAGEANFVFSPRLAFEWAPETVRLLLNLGYRLREDVRFASLRVRDQILFNLALAVGLGRSGVSLVAEADIAFSAVDPVSSGAENQGELRFGLTYDDDNGFYARFAAGPGVMSGWGTPGVRVVAQVGYAGRVFVGDADGDRLMGATDQCPSHAEDYDGFEDGDGCPDLDNDGDGIADIDDRCPLSREDLDGFQDEDGCPELDNAAVLTERREEEASQLPAAPEVKESSVQVQDGQIILGAAMLFETATEALTPEALVELRSLARYLVAHPELGVVRVEAHSDSTGDRMENQARTENQANLVVEQLIRGGVPSGRLISKGWGELRPIASNTTEEGREENQRVEFWIEGH